MSVVLPASGCEIMANVRRLATSRASVLCLVCVSGASEGNSGSFQVIRYPRQRNARPQSMRGTVGNGVAAGGPSSRTFETGRTPGRCPWPVALTSVMLGDGGAVHSRTVRHKQVIGQLSAAVL